MKPSTLKNHTGKPSVSLLAALNRLLTRKIWLPTILYEGLPYFYALAGIGAVACTLFVSSWYWVLPYYWLLGLLCLHAAVYVWRIRRHYRRARRENEARQADTNSADAISAARHKDSKLPE